MPTSLTTHLWQSTFFALAAGLLTVAFRKNRAQVRYWLWLSASLKFFFPFALLLNLGSRLEPLVPAARQIATPVVSYTIEQFSGPFLAESLPTPPPAPDAIHWLPVAIAAAWLFGFATVGLIRFLNWLRIRAAVHASTATNIEATVEIRVSPGLLAPGVVGIGRPILLLPEGIEDRLTPSELNAVLAHELCHIRRRDNLFAATHMIVETIFWFHPLVWWIGARLVEERERACDEEVLSQGNKPDVYADAILNVCKLYTESPLTCVSGVSGASIRRRIETIMSNRKLRGLTGAKKLLLTLAGTAALVGPVAIGILIGVRNIPVIHAQSPAPQVAQTQTAPAQKTTPPTPTADVPKFEAVSIRPCEPPSGGGRGPNGGSGRPPVPIVSPGRLHYSCIAVQQLINSAYVLFAAGRIHGPTGVPTAIEGMPDWVRMNPGPNFNPANRYALEATAEGTPSQEMMMGPMLQTVLEDRFKLKIHQETRAVPAYALTAAKSAARLVPFAEGSCFSLDFTKFPPVGPPPGQVPCERGLGRKGPNIAVAEQGESMAGLALMLNGVVGRLVIDKTGITGLFDIEFEYGPDENTPGSIINGDPNSYCTIHAGNNLPVCRTPPGGADDPAGPSIFTVLEKQFGLKLEPTTGQKEFLVIDHIDRPSEN